MSKKFNLGALLQQPDADEKLEQIKQAANAEREEEEKRRVEEEETELAAQEVQEAEAEAEIEAEAEEVVEEPEETDTKKKDPQEAIIRLLKGLACFEEGDEVVQTAGHILSVSDSESYGEFNGHYQQNELLIKMVRVFNSYIKTKDDIRKQSVKVKQLLLKVQSAIHSGEYEDDTSKILVFAEQILQKLNSLPVDKKSLIGAQILHQLILIVEKELIQLVWPLKKKGGETKIVPPKETLAESKVKESVAKPKEMKSKESTAKSAAPTKPAAAKSTATKPTTVVKPAANKNSMVQEMLEKAQAAETTTAPIKATPAKTTATKPAAEPKPAVAKNAGATKKGGKFNLNLLNQDDNGEELE